MELPEDLYYTKTHEWAKKKGAEFIVGLTHYAQEQLRDVVFVELPNIGKEVEQGKPCAVVESVKAASDIYAPVSGKVTKVNTKLVSRPELVNKDSYGEGWFFAIEQGASKKQEPLLTKKEYLSFIQKGSE